MNGANSVQLPASGLAEEILAGFMLEAQAQADQQAQGAAALEERESFHLVSFLLGEEYYGVPIVSVQEIIRATGITRVPGAAEQVRGVINLRGRIIPVLDLRKRLGLCQLEESAAQRIMVVELGEKRLGLLVDSVSQVIRVPAALVEELPEETLVVEEKYLQGVGKLEDRLIFILDLTGLLLSNGFAAI